MNELVNYFLYKSNQIKPFYTNKDNICMNIELEYSVEKGSQRSK